MTAISKGKLVDGLWRIWGITDTIGTTTLLSTTTKVKGSLPRPPPMPNCRRQLALALVLDGCGKRVEVGFAAPATLPSRCVRCQAANAGPP